MDHGGQFGNEGGVMSQVQVGGVDLCDNLQGPEALTAQTRNLNETNRLAQTLEKEDEGGRGLIQKPSVNNSREGIEEGQEKDEGGREEEEEEEDLDEVMKEAEEEEVSEGSNSFICCQSPDTPMTDSSYSETGSLLETPYPFSPGTSPEPTSPVIPVMSPEAAYPISPVELSQSDVKAELHTSNTAAVASDAGSVSQGPTCTTKPKDSSTLTKTSGVSPPGSASTTDSTDRIAKNITTEHFTSSAEPIYEHGSTCGGGVARSHTEPTAAAGGTTEISATATARESTESTSTAGPGTSDWEQMTSAWLSVSTCTTGPTPSPALLESLEHLAQRGDDTHLPHCLHQIAEAFVLHKDYQQALCCLQLERLYHQRVLDNLNALQEQWESKCSRTSPNLVTQHLDTLKHICQTHTRPRAEDAVCASLDVFRPHLESGAEPPCSTACQTGAGMEQRVKGSSDYQSSHPVISSINLADGLKSPEVAEKDRGDPDREGRDSFLGGQLTERQSSREEGAVAEGGGGYTIPAPGNELHPSSAGEMDQSEAAEQQGGAQEKEVKKEDEDGDVEEATEALEMEDDGEDEEEEKQEHRDSPFCQKSLPVQTLVSGSEVEIQQLHQEPLTEETHQEQTQESATTRLHQDTEQQQQQTEEEEEEEYDYEVEQADIIREAASLDAMAKLITVEEMSPASGLTSILKKRSVCTEDVGVSTVSESRPDKPAAKRRVRFRVPEDNYENDVGGADSCLLLFLLCLVTVVISVGGTALYCALGDSQSSVCQDFSRNADFYIGQIQKGISQLQHWFTSSS